MCAIGRFLTDLFDQCGGACAESILPRKLGRRVGPLSKVKYLCGASSDERRPCERPRAGRVFGPLEDSRLVSDAGADVAA